MNDGVLAKLLAIMMAVSIGWLVGRTRWLGEADAGGTGGDPARVLSNAAFFIFVPALMFRSTARIDFHHLPWTTLLGFFMPVVLGMLACYAWLRWRGHGAVASPSVRAITASFGNTLQVGVPVAAAVFGEQGLAVHITVVSLHALTLLSVLTLLVELDLARAAHAQDRQSLRATMLATARNTVVHPVVLPVLAGLAWNATGWRLPQALDEVLAMLGTAVVPLCLTLIGMSLAYYGWPARWRSVLGLLAWKLLVLPGLVLALGLWVLKLPALPLAVIVMMAALPPGSNALIFAQRYRCEESETTAAVVLGTLLFALSAPLWLKGLARLGLL